MSDARLSTASLTLQKQPHLTIVAVSRNDDHGGDMLSRMQHFVDGFIAQCRKHQLNAELILIEWNPPPERPSLEHVLTWPDEFGPASVRIVTVPPEVHAKFPHAGALPLFQMIGKNVGIRRAWGTYVLATNIDILLDDATVIYLRDRLTPKTMLRIDRYDVPGDLSKGVPFGQVLAECRRRFFQINTRFGIFDVKRRRFINMGDSIEARLLALHTETRVFGPIEPACRALGYVLRTISGGASAFGHAIVSGLLAWRTVPTRVAKAVGGAIQLCFWAVLKTPGFLGRNIPKLLPLSTMPSRAYWYIRRAMRRVKARIAPSIPWPLLKGYRALRRLWSMVFFIPRRLVSAFRSFAKAWRLMGPQTLFRSRSPVERRLARSQRLHTWACGDFTLASREDWFRLRGYPEWPMYSWHIDSAFMFVANAHGLHEVMLKPPCRIYHIDHSVGSGWSPDGAAQLFSRLRSRGIPFLSNDNLHQWRMRAANDPSDVIVNRPDWGLAGYDLPERHILPSGRAAGEVHAEVIKISVEA